MKKSVLATVVALGMITGLSAFASEFESAVYPNHPSKTVSADLDRISIDAELDYSNQIAKGSILHDIGRNTLQLILFRKNNCPVHAYCFVGVLPPVIVTLPIVNVAPAGCGSTAYTARKDLRMVDGDLQVLQLTDNTHRICEDMRPGTEVTYTIETGGRNGEKTFRSYFTGGVMSPIAVIQ